MAGIAILEHANNIYYRSLSDLHEIQPDFCLTSSFQYQTMFNMLLITAVNNLRMQLIRVIAL